MDWIKVEDKLPRTSKDCLIYSEKNGIELGYYQMPVGKYPGKFMTFAECFGDMLYCKRENITHWMPIEEPKN